MGGSSVAPPLTSVASTWDRINAEVLTPNCTVGCHVANSEDAKQSGLVLEQAVAYENLVGVPVKNNAAREDGMLRVKPGSPDASYLYWKILFVGSPTGRDYGSPMPISGQPITNGQIEYIRRWIAAGAPRTGIVADTAVLADRTRFDRNAFTALAPPAQGFQLHIDPFTAQPNFEREIFVYKKVGSSADVFVNRIETKMRTGSHHLLVYTFRANTNPVAIPQLNVVRDIRNADGSMSILNMIPMAYHVFFAGSMTPSSDYRFPAGVALKLAGGAAVDLNTHYVNAGTTSITGEAYVNLHTVPQAEVQREARALDFANTSLSLPPRQRTTMIKSFTVNTTTTIFVLTSHMHKRGEKFVIKLKGGPRDGEIVYENTEWAHPLVKTFMAPIVLQAGQGLTSEITYFNETDRLITFGLTSEDEMGIIFGYAY